MWIMLIIEISGFMTPKLNKKGLIKANYLITAVGLSVGGYCLLRLLSTGLYTNRGL